MKSIIDQLGDSLDHFRSFIVTHQTNPLNTKIKHSQYIAAYKKLQCIITQDDHENPHVVQICH